MIRIRNSEVISEIKDTLDYKVHFRINSIDSIGNYVPYLNKGYLSFKTYGDSILLSSGNTTPYNSSPGACCHFVLVIRTEEPMDAYNTRGRIIRKKKGKTFNEVWLGQTIRQQVRGNKNIDVVFK